MAKFNDNRLIVEGVVVWDGINRPDTNKDGKLVHNLKLVLINQGEIAEVQTLATEVLNTGVFRGQFPNGGKWPLTPVQPGEFGGGFDGLCVINPKTWNGAPQVYSLEGQLLSPMQYGQQIYNGALVKVLIHAFDFKNESKGISLGLDGVQIVDATRERLAIGGSGASAAAAFGSGTAPQGQAPGYGQPQQAPQGQAPGYGQPQQAPQGQAPGYGQPQQAPQGQAPGYGQPQQAPQGQAPGYGQPQQAPQGQAPGYGQPQQQQGAPMGYGPDPNFIPQR